MGSPVMTRALWGMLMLSLSLEAHALGRLFFTPAERQALDRVSAPVPPHIAKGTKALRVDGWFVDARGRYWFWIGGRLYRENQPKFHPRLHRNAVSLRWRGHRLYLRPGQVARIENGTLVIEKFADE